MHDPDRGNENGRLGAAVWVPAQVKKANVSCMGNAVTDL